MKTVKLSVIIFLSFIIVSHQTVVAQAGITWTGETSASKDTWDGVTYGKGLFVAVTSGGIQNPYRVMTSPDGITWTSQAATFNIFWKSVIYADNLFVAVGAGNGPGAPIMTSPDGITWTLRTTFYGTGLKSITYGKGLFVAVGSDQFGREAVISPDGINWTKHVIPAPIGGSNWQSVTYGNGLFVTVANSLNGSGIITSPDGITWTPRTSPSENIWVSVAYGNGVFVAVASSVNGNGVMTSPDGVTWTSRTPVNNVWNNVTYGSGLFVAVGKGSRTNPDEVMTSADGITWTSRAAVSNNWNCVTYGNGIFVAVSETSGGSLQQVMISGTLGTLAIQWLNINGTFNSSGNAELSWRVNENSVKNYAIEKSKDGAHYSTIATIPSKGNGENSYVFTEADKLTTAAWYRVKQTDIDGQINYSRVIFITTNNHNNIKVYPNPARDAIEITVSDRLLNKTAKLTSIDGKLLQSLRITSVATTINLAAYSAGVYFLQIENEKPVEISKQ